MMPKCKYCEADTKLTTWENKKPPFRKDRVCQQCFRWLTRIHTSKKKWFIKE